MPAKLLQGIILSMCLLPLHNMDHHASSSKAHSYPSNVKEILIHDILDSIQGNSYNDSLLEEERLSATPNTLKTGGGL